MENAVKALLMAAGVLIGVLVLSLGVTLYSALSSYTEQMHEDIAQNEQDRFNAQFTGYIRNDLTIQDIITVANIAYENNLKNGSSYYIEVKIGEDNIENEIHEKAITLLEDESIYSYKCTNENVKYNMETGRIKSIKFEKNEE